MSTGALRQKNESMALRKSSLGEHLGYCPLVTVLLNTTVTQRANSMYNSCGHCNLCQTETTKWIKTSE